MKKILGSVGVLAVVGALVLGATGAFFSDTETSTGNTFTAGAIDLQISSQCSYNGGNSNTNCGHWSYPGDGGPVTLGKFFDFSDLKPGDWGENTISFKVLTNEAWMCAAFTSTSSENGLVEPELAMNPIDTDTYGELGEELEIMWWHDKDGDNALDIDEPPLFGGPRNLEEWLGLTGNTANEGNGTLPLTFADSYLNWTTWDGSYEQPNTLGIKDEQHLGVAWCLGNMILDPGNGAGFTCDGSVVDNYSQTDKIVADLSFTVEQQRNQPNFRCPENINRQ